MYKLGTSQTINASLEKQNLTISQSTQTSGDTFDHTHFGLTISGISNFNAFLIDLRILHQDWGNPSNGPLIGLQQGTTSNDPMLLVDVYVSFAHLEFIQRNVIGGTVKDVSITYFGDVFPKTPNNGFEQRPLIQLIWQ